MQVSVIVIDTSVGTVALRPYLLACRVWPVAERVR
jgi:hypothetical protein